MKIKILLLVTTVLMASLNATAQNDSTTSIEKVLDYQYKNIGKISTLALAFENISLTYERAILPGMTVSLNAGYKGRTEIPNLFGFDSLRISVSSDGIKGLSLTPEFRYYLKSCENQVPNGFYAAFYVRYINYKSMISFNYFPDYPDFSNSQHIKSDISFIDFGVGFMLGYQLTIKQRFLVDFIIIGPRQSWITMKHEFDTSVSDEFLDDLEHEIQNVIDRFGIDRTINVTNPGTKEVKFKYNFTDVRFGISIGYAF